MEINITIHKCTQLIEITHYKDNEVINYDFIECKVFLVMQGYLQQLKI